MVNWLVGEVPETVHATGYASHPLWQEVRDVDTSAALFTYPSGAVAMIDNCRNAPVGYDQRVEVQCHSLLNFVGICLVIISEWPPLSDRLLCFW